MSYWTPPDRDTEDHSRTETMPEGPGGLAGQWPAAAGAAAAVFVAEAVTAASGKPLGAWVLPGLGAAAYLMMAVRVGGKTSKGWWDFIFMGICGMSLPFLYLGAAISNEILPGIRELAPVVYSAFGAAFAVSYYAFGFRAAYPPRSPGLDWGLIVPVILMSAALGLLILTQTIAAIFRIISPSTEIPPAAVYTFSSAIFFLNSLVVIAGALAKTLRTRHPADLVQIIARVLMLVSYLAVQVVFRFAGPLDLGKEVYMLISLLPSAFFNLVFAAAFFASPDPPQN